MIYPKLLFKALPVENGFYSVLLKISIKWSDKSSNIKSQEGFGPPCYNILWVTLYFQNSFGVLPFLAHKIKPPPAPAGSGYDVFTSWCPRWQYTTKSDNFKRKFTIRSNFGGLNCFICEQQNVYVHFALFLYTTQKWILQVHQQPVQYLTSYRLSILDSFFDTVLSAYTKRSVKQWNCKTELRHALWKPAWRYASAFTISAFGALRLTLSIPFMQLDFFL